MFLLRRPTFSRLIFSLLIIFMVNNTCEVNRKKILSKNKVKLTSAKSL